MTTKEQRRVWWWWWSLSFVFVVVVVVFFLYRVSQKTGDETLKIQCLFFALKHPFEPTFSNSHKQPP